MAGKVLVAYRTRETVDHCAKRSSVGSRGWAKPPLESPKDGRVGVASHLSPLGLTELVDNWVCVLGIQTLWENNSGGKYTNQSVLAHPLNSSKFERHSVHAWLLGFGCTSFADSDSEHCFAYGMGSLWAEIKVEEPQPASPLDGPGPSATTTQASMRHALAPLLLVWHLCHHVDV